MPPPDRGEASSSSNTNITVAVRVRPLSLKEKERQSWATVEVLDDAHVLVRLTAAAHAPSAHLLAPSPPVRARLSP